MSKKSNDGAAVLAGCLAVLVAIPIVFVLSALFVLLAWNVGVTAVVSAAGGHVDNIGFWAALGIAVALNLLGGVFKTARATE